MVPPLREYNLSERAGKQLSKLQDGTGQLSIKSFTSTS